MSRICQGHVLGVEGLKVTFRRRGVWGAGGTAVQQPSKTDGQSPEVAGPLSNVAPGPLGAMGSSMNPGPSPLRPACRQNLSNASN